jgi:hypothetical protein
MGFGVTPARRTRAHARGRRRFDTRSNYHAAFGYCRSVVDNPKPEARSLDQTVLAPRRITLTALSAGPLLAPLPTMAQEPPQLFGAETWRGYALDDRDPAMRLADREHPAHPRADIATAAPSKLAGQQPAGRRRTGDGADWVQTRDLSPSRTPSRPTAVRPILPCCGAEGAVLGGGPVRRLGSVLRAGEVAAPSPPCWSSSEPLPRPRLTARVTATGFDAPPSSGHGPIV